MLLAYADMYHTLLPVNYIGMLNFNVHFGFNPYACSVITLDLLMQMIIKPRAVDWLLGQLD